MEFCGVNITAAKMVVSLSRDFRITGVYVCMHVFYQLSGLAEIFKLRSRDTTIGREISRYFATCGRNAAADCSCCDYYGENVNRHKGNRTETALSAVDRSLWEKAAASPFLVDDTRSIDFCKRFWIYGVLYDMASCPFSR